MSTKTKSGHFPAFDDLVSTGEYQWRNREAMRCSQKDIVSNQACWARLFGAAKAAPHCSQALGLFIEIINFFIEPRQFGFRRVGTSQLVKRLTDGKFGFSHDNLTFSIRGYSDPNQP